MAVQLDDVQKNLDAGLKFYGDGEPEAAIDCWNEVLRLDPQNQAAVDYLTTAGAPLSKPDRSATSRDAKVIAFKVSTSRLADRIKQLLAERQFDAALEMLFRAKAEGPENAAAIGRTIQHVKDKIVVDRLECLGGLDQIAKRMVSKDLLDRVALSSDQRDLMGLIDGVSSVGDLVRMASLERYSTLSALLDLQQLDLIQLRDPNFSLPPKVVPAGVAAQVKALYTTPPAFKAPVAPTLKAPEPCEADSGADRFDEIFQQATVAYMQSEISMALKLYHECLSLRPDDRRVAHNIARLTPKDDVG